MLGNFVECRADGHLGDLHVTADLPSGEVLDGVISAGLFDEYREGKFTEEEFLSRAADVLGIGG
jgi:hypothetical protein